jgi:aryl-alcohol dehydrogenase-like predicted oxidoreductase
MSPHRFDPDRRRLLSWLACGAVTASLSPVAAVSAGTSALTRPIPSSGEPLPAIGMGTWITFDVGDYAAARAVRVEVLQTFLDRGGTLVDSSPMYGHAQEVMGYCLQRVSEPGRLFAATKVWTPGRWFGIQQMRGSQERWGVPRFDLMQVHNLVDSENHLETLAEWKAEGRIRFTGVTTSHGRRHEQLVRIMEREPIDFVQFTYNLADREAERQLLPLAAERGLAVIINRPFRGGSLFDRVAGKPLPPWAGEFDCRNWAQFFLKFVISHPAVTCAIPATSRVDHMEENMGALYGRLPEPPLRERMARVLTDL